MEFLQANLDYLVLGTLGLMSFVMLALVIERYLYLNKVSLQQFDHIETLKIDLTRNLTTLSSIGSNAPYVGLLGTVLGILVTFYTMGQGGKIEERVQPYKDKVALHQRNIEAIQKELSKLR